MNEINNEIIQFTSEIRYHLLTFLDGLDATNFLQITNENNCFGSIATASDHMFREFMKKLFRNQQRIFLPRNVYEKYLDECEVFNDKLVPTESHYSFFIQPYQRIFVHKCFSIEGFGKLCRVYKAPSFQCYSRLLPFNGDLYYADFGLLEYEFYNRSICSERDLNNYERKLFKVDSGESTEYGWVVANSINRYFNTQTSEHRRTSMKFVSTIEEFRKNLASRFLSLQWFHTIDFSKFYIVGGSVLNALCYSEFPDTREQDVNFIYHSDYLEDFELAVTDIIVKLQNAVSTNSKHLIEIQKTPGSLRYDIILPCGVKLNFNHKFPGNSINPISHILHNFDIDVCQVAFTGTKIISTFAFAQALATKTFVTYSLHAEIPKHVCNRIAKYCARGFHFLEPITFDGNLEIMMKQADIPLYRFEERQFFDEDGEVRISKTEYWRAPARNIDTFELQELFIAAIYS